MNILHVLSQYEVNGAETYAATLADECVRLGDSVIIVSDTFRTPTLAKVFSQPIGNRSYVQRLRNIRFLVKVIKENNINVVHAHSRAASWVAYFATRFAKVPLVSSIHMRQHLHFSSRHFSVYGEKLIAVCGAIYDHLKEDMRFPPHRIVMIPNGIDLSRWNYQPEREAGEKKIVAVIGRFTGFKGDALVAFLSTVVPTVAQEFPAIEFHIVGGMSDRERIENVVASVNAQIGRTAVVLRGFTMNVEAVYHTANVVVGAGRVAMEALACGTPVVATGESTVIGLVTPETADQAFYSNFGDLDARKPFDSERCIQALGTICRNPSLHSPQWGRSFVESSYDIKKVVQHIRDVYASCTTRKQ